MNADARTSGGPQVNGEIERFNFSGAVHLGAEHHRTLRALDEQFARNLTYTLGAWLRTDVAVTPQPGEHATYFTFAEQVVETGYALPVRMEPMHVRGAMSLDLSLVTPMVDLLLGGSGRTAGTHRELTEIEEAILGSVMELIIRELNVVWRSLGTEFTLEAREREGQEQRLMVATEKVLILRFEVLMPELQGRLSLCLPASALNTLLRNLSNRHGRTHTRTAEERTEIAARLKSAKTFASLQFPPVRISTKELQGMQPGRLLRLNLAGNTQGRLLVGGVPTFISEPVRLGERRGGRIISVDREKLSTTQSERSEGVNNGHAHGDNRR